MNRIKPEDGISEEVARQMLNNIQQRLATHPPLSDSHFLEVSALATKLENEKLLDQCRIAQSRYHETLEIVQNTQSQLVQTPPLNGDDRLLSPVLSQWNPVSASTPGNFNVGRRRSLGSFPYIYKCNHHAAGHECSCDPAVTRDPSKPIGTVQRQSYSQCQCVCGTLPKPLGDIRESAEDLLEDKCDDWEYNGSRAALKRHLRRTCTWQYPAEGFDDQDNNSNRSSHSGESDNKDLEDHEVNSGVPSVPVSLSVNSHLYCHASNLSLNIAAQGDQIKDAKTQK